MSFSCLVCKEFVEDRFEVEVRDKNVDTSFTAHVCRFCYNKFLESHHNQGFFKVAKMVNWLRKKPPMRAF